MNVSFLCEYLCEELEVRCLEGNKMLNFLYKVPLITRVKATNTKVGRKYARNERLSYPFVTQDIMLMFSLFIRLFTISCRLKH